MTRELAHALEVLVRAQDMLEPVLSGYERQLALYGADPKAAFWKDGERQTRRYQILSRLFAAEDRQGGVTVTDFGCGYGAFFDFLKDRQVMTGSRYIGVDLSAKMIDEARRRIHDPRASFQRHMILTEDGDYTFACGTYNMNMDADAGEWVDYVKASLKQLWSHTRKGLGFNMLSAGAVQQFPGLYYAEPDEFVDFCKRNFGPDVSLTDDRPLPDWTIFVRRT
jgi:SAM-dependent methyltransferase